MRSRQYSTPRRAIQRQKYKLKTSRRRPLWVPSRRLRLITLFVIVVFFAVIRFRLRDMPLERDEGEYAYSGQLILQGVPPYKLAYNMKLPGTYAAYAVIMAALGQSPAGIHVGLLLMNAVTIGLLYLLAAHLFGPIAGLVSAASYGALSISASVLGLQAHATHFVAFAAAAGLFVLLRAVEQRKLWQFFLSGILLGLAFLMKQPGIFFCAFAAFYVLHQGWRLHDLRRTTWRLNVLFLGMTLPYALTCIVLWKAGVFSRFWFWTVSYARQYGTIFSAGEGWEKFVEILPGVISGSLPIWILGALGISAIWWDAQARRHRVFLLVLLTFSFLAVCPGFHFRPHYFIVLLPAASLLAGVGICAAISAISERTNSSWVRTLPALAFLALLGICLLSQQELLFAADPITAGRLIYGAAQPFEQALVIGDYVRTHSQAGSRIAVLGSEPEIYFYSHRHSATGYIYIYPLMEEQNYAQGMQKEMISEIETSRPEFLALVRFPVSWLRGPNSDTHIIEWMANYIPDQYELVGVADLQSPDHTEYRWDSDAASYQTDSPYAIFLFRRHS